MKLFVAPVVARVNAHTTPLLESADTVPVVCVYPEQFAGVLTSDTQPFESQMTPVTHFE
jgi:hypothetical protein